MDKRERFIRENLEKGKVLKVFADTHMMDGNIFSQEFEGKKDILPAIEFMSRYLIIDVEIRERKPLLITIYDDFLKREMSGVFSSEQEARGFYALELGTFEENIKIIKATECE